MAEDDELGRYAAGDGSGAREAPGRGRGSAGWRRQAWWTFVSYKLTQMTSACPMTP